MTERRELISGWAWPAQAGKAHYFNAGEVVSLCGRWMFGGERTEDNRRSLDDCAACRRVLDGRVNHPSNWPSSP